MKDEIQIKKEKRTEFLNIFADRKKRVVAPNGYSLLNTRLTRVQEGSKLDQLQKGSSYDTNLTKKTFAHVAKLITIQVLLSLALNIDWILHKLVKNVFLHRKLEEVYMEVPIAIETNKSREKVCKLYITEISLWS